jgi:hypothetical protein
MTAEGGSSFLECILCLRCNHAIVNNQHVWCKGGPNDDAIIVQCPTCHRNGNRCVLSGDD